MADSTARPASYSRAFRVVLGVFLAVTVGFIVWTSTGVIRQIYAHAIPSRAERLPPLAPACETGLQRLGVALDQGLKASLWSDTEEAAAAGFERAIAPEWRNEADVERACSADITAKSAFAAMVRQRRVQEGWVRRHARETLAAAGGAWRFLPVESRSAEHISR